MAKNLIDESFQFALRRWNEGLKENNQKQYWLPRVVHFTNELNWVDRQLLNLKPSSVYNQDKVAKEYNG